MSNHQAELARWRAVFHYDPDLEPWPRDLSSLLDVQERLGAAANFLTALDPADADEKKLGIAIAALAFTFVDRVYEHLGVGYQPLAHTPINLTLALVALRNVLADADEKIIAKRMQLSKIPAPVPKVPTLAGVRSDAPTKPALAGDASAPNRRKREEIPDDYEANILIKKFLDQHPRATVRDVSAAVGLSVGKVAQMDAWRREMGKRKAEKEPPKKKERPLTPKMLAAIGKDDDVAARLDAEDAIWRRIMEEAAHPDAHGVVPGRHEHRRSPPASG